MTEKDYEFALYALGATNVTTKRQNNNGTTAYKLQTGQVIAEYKSGYIRRNLFQENIFSHGRCYQLNPTYDVPHKWIHHNGLVETTRKERVRIWSRSERLKRLILYTIKKKNNKTKENE